MSWKVILLRTLFILTCLVAALGSCKSKKNSVVSNGSGQKNQGKNPTTKTAAPQKTITHTEWYTVLGVTNEERKKNKLYHFINDWYGVPYKYGGCQKTGVDCSCFANILYEEVYEKKISRMSLEIFKAADKISMDDVKEGDLLFFKISGNTISHIGVYLTKNYFIHSSTSKGVMLSSVEEAYYKKFLYCAGRLKSA